MQEAHSGWKIEGLWIFPCRKESISKLHILSVCLLDTHAEMPAHPSREAAAEREISQWLEGEAACTDPAHTQRMLILCTVQHSVRYLCRAARAQHMLRFHPEGIGICS